MTPQQVVHDNWADILYQLGYEHDGSYNLEHQTEFAQRLGTKVFDHMTASINDMNWEGYSEEDLLGIASLLKDLTLAIRHE